MINDDRVVKRTFQANTRVITASNTLLGDLVNIMR